MILIIRSLNWVTPLYILAIYGITRYFSKPKKESKKGRINWTPLEAIGITLAIYFVAQLAGGLLVYAYPLLRGWSPQQITDLFEKSVYGQFILVGTVEALTVWFLFQFLKRRGAYFNTIGLRRQPNWRDGAYVLAGFAVYFLLFITAVSIVKAVTHLNLDQEQIIGFKGAQNLQLVFVFASLVILPPLVEELLIRGFLYSGLKKGLPKLWAVVITGTLFAVAHLQAGNGQPLLWVAAIDTFILSTVLIYLREKTGSLWASIGLHMLKNSLAFLSIFIFHVV